MQNTPKNNLATILAPMPRRQLLRLERFLKASGLRGFMPLNIEISRALDRRRGEKLLPHDPAADDLDYLDAAEVDAGARCARAVAGIICDGPNRCLFETLAAKLEAEAKLRLAKSRAEWEARLAERSTGENVAR